MTSTTECDIRENFDTNECPNIFVSTKLHEWISEYIHTNFFDTNECPNKYSYWKLHEYSNIFEYSSRFYTLTHSPTNVRIYSYKQIWHERMSEYIRKRKIDTNECPNIYSWPICSNIRIFKYSSHSNRVWFWYERISQYIRIKKIDTNECPNKYSYRKYLNIRIFKYIRHTLVHIH